MGGVSWLCCRVGIDHTMMMSGRGFGLQSISMGLYRSSLAVTVPFADKFPLTTEVVALCAGGSQAISMEVLTCGLWAQALVQIITKIDC